MTIPCSFAVILSRCHKRKFISSTRLSLYTSTSIFYVADASSDNFVDRLNKERRHMQIARGFALRGYVAVNILDLFYRQTRRLCHLMCRHSMIFSIQTEVQFVERKREIEFFL